MSTTQSSEDGRPLVLIIEDDPHLQRWLTQVVELEGCTSLIATSEIEGYGLLSEHYQQIAIVLIDVTVRNIDPYAFRQLQLDAPRVARIQTVIMGGNLNDQEHALLRPSAVLAVPLQLSELRALVAAMSITRTGTRSYESGLDSPSTTFTTRCTHEHKLESRL